MPDLNSTENKRDSSIQGSRKQELFHFGLFILNRSDKLIGRETRQDKRNNVNNESLIFTRSTKIPKKSPLS